jgi:TolA-binding protein
MKKHILYSGSIILASLIIAAALVSARHPAQTQTDNGQQLKELKAQVGRLETKAAALQKELNELHKQTPTVIYTPANQLIPATTTESERPEIPPGWKPFEFNGITYYLTPLAHEAEVSMLPTKQTGIPVESLKLAK